MKLAKAFAILFAVLAVRPSLVPGLGAQGKPAQKPKAAVPAPNAAAPSPEGAPAREKAQAGTSKRDPFAPLINEKRDSNSVSHLPPGKAGLVIATTHVDGTVRSHDGMIAVVSNPEQHVYFVREGDRLYDGDVEKIGLDGVTFRENSKDTFGKPVDRMVTKRIYASAGEQQ
jgi:Tfp pilus assembly protein PilP